MLKRVFTYLFIAFNGLLSALAYELFVFPNEFAPAGIGGICTMIQYVLGINVGYLNLLVNVPLAIAVAVLISKPMAIRAFVYNCFFSAFLVMFDYIDISPFIYHTETGTSTILGPLVGGIIMGYSCALLLKVGTHGGGIYYVSSLVRKYAPHLNFFWVSFGLNVLVAVISFFVYGRRIEPVLLCILYFFASSTVNSKLTKSSYSAVRFEIITNDPEMISQAIIRELHHSATLLPAKGIYKGEATSVLVCIVNNTQVAALSALLRSFPGTFAAVSHVDEVVGNFKRLDNHGNPEKQLLDVGDARVD